MKTLPRKIGLNIFIIALSFLPHSLFSQIRIDKQQCFGGYGDEYCVDLVIEKDYILLVGDTERDFAGTGHVPQDCANSRPGDPCWIVKINHDYEVIDSWCYGDMGFAEGWGYIFKIDDKNEYYLTGVGHPDICDNNGQSLNIVAKRINSDGEEIWTRGYGTRNGCPSVHACNGVLANDGGVICHGNYITSGCDMSHSFGNGDCWIVALDSLGNMKWETTIGTPGQDSFQNMERSKQGGYIFHMTAEPLGNDYGCLSPCDGSIPMSHNGLIVKLDDYGNVEWNECYGVTHENPYEQCGFTAIVELEDGGYICCGDTMGDSGDLSGSGWHYGTLHNIPNGPLTNDAWLLRLDGNRNIIWSRCYGGSDMDFASIVFPMKDGGFMVFGGTYSNDGDVSSSAHLNLQDENVGTTWVFRTDADGNLLWERCIGKMNLGQTVPRAVYQHNDREYTIAGQMVCPYSSAYQGDIDCSNCAVTHNPESPYTYDWDYWILHITDTVDYTTLQVLEQPMPMEEASVEVYPNPANKTVCVVLPNEAETTQMELVNMKGQVVAAKTFSGKSSWIEMGGLPQGMYALRIRNAEVCLTRKVLRE